jgi:hypothetical protein
MIVRHLLEIALGFVRNGNFQMRLPCRYTPPSRIPRDVVSLGIGDRDDEEDDEGDGNWRGGAGAAVAAAQWDAKLGDPLHIWVGNPDAAQARAWADAHLAAAQAQMDALLAVKGERTVENTLRPYDEAQREMDLAGSGASLLTNASPKKELRDVGDEVLQKVSARRRR